MNNITLTCVFLQVLYITYIQTLWPQYFYKRLFWVIGGVIVCFKMWSLPVKNAALLAVFEFQSFTCIKGTFSGIFMENAIML